MLEFRKMREDELNECAMLAAEAFYSYEYFSTYIAEEKRRERFLNALIRSEFKANIRNAEVNFITARKNGKIVAVAQLCMPGFERPSDMRYIASGYLGALCIGGIHAVSAWLKMDQKASAPCHELPGRNWYLSLFTVAKSDEGTGIGSDFLQEYLIPYVKAADGECLSLFTNSKINCRFYEKNGFSIFDEKTFEYEGKTIGSWSYRMKLN